MVSSIGRKLKNSYQASFSTQEKKWVVLSLTSSEILLKRFPRFCYTKKMKRAFAIIIVVLLALGMIGTLIPAFGGGGL